MARNVAPIVGRNTDEIDDSFISYGVEPQHLPMMFATLMSNKEYFADATQLLDEYFDMVNQYGPGRDVKLAERPDPNTGDAYGNLLDDILFDDTEEESDVDTDYSGLDDMFADEDDVREYYGVNNLFDDSEFLDEHEYQGLSRLLDDKDFINEHEYQGLSNMFGQGYFIPTKFTNKDRSLNNACAFRGNTVFLEYENEAIYVPHSFYCGVKAINKFLELTNYNQLVPLKGKKLNPYKITKQILMRHVARYLVVCPCEVKKDFKMCDDKCIKKKIKQLKEGKWRNDGATLPEHIYLPEFARLRYERGKRKVEVKTLSKGKAMNPKYILGMSLVENGNHHVVLIKNKSLLTLADLKFRIGKNLDMHADAMQVKLPVPKDIAEHVLIWDCETSVKESETKKSKFVLEGVKGRIISNRTGEKLCEDILVIRNYLYETQKEAIARFVNLVHQSMISLVGEGKQKLIAYAHNSAGFDTHFIKKDRTQKWLKTIKVGNKIKSLTGNHKLDNSVLTIKYQDTLPFNMQSLSVACQTFKTEHQKLDFDIVDKTDAWYHHHQSQEHYDRYRRSKDKEPRSLEGDYTFYWQDWDENGKIITGKTTKHINKDWVKYLDGDINALTDYYNKLNIMFRDIGCDITSYMGSAGIAWDTMGSHCYNFSKLYVPIDPCLKQFIHASIYGGRNLHFKKSFDGVYDERTKKWIKFLICIDMNSLYPSSMFGCAFPLGKMKVATPEMLASGDIFNYPHYIIEAKIRIPNIRYAFHPYRTEAGTIIYPTNGVYQGVYNDVEIKEMLKDGYEIVEVLRGIYWNRSGKIFTNLINQLYAMRNEYKALGENHEEYAKNEILKVVLNSMYGKFNETIRSVCKFIGRDDIEQAGYGIKEIFFKNGVFVKGRDYKEDRLKYNTKPTKADKREVENIKKGKFSVKKLSDKARLNKMPNGDYEVSETLNDPQIKKPTYIAGYILSYSRAIGNEIIRKIGAKNLYYSDTDSFYMDNKTFEDAKLKCGNSLCQFKNDYGDGVQIIRARFLDIKRCYFEFNKTIKSAKYDFSGKPSAIVPFVNPKTGKVPEDCHDVITRKVNLGEAYDIRYFKCKFTGINFKDVEGVKAYENDIKNYNLNPKKEISEYYQGMSDMLAIIDALVKKNEDRELIAKCRTDEEKKDMAWLLGYKNYNVNRIKKYKKILLVSDRDTHVDANELCELYHDISFMMNRFEKDGRNVYINYKQFSYCISPHKRADWDGNIYYAKGFSRKDKEFMPLPYEEIGSLVKSFDHIPNTDYGLFQPGTGKDTLKCVRPLIFEDGYLAHALYNGVLENPDPIAITPVLLKKYGKEMKKWVSIFNKNLSNLPKLKKFIEDQCKIERVVYNEIIKTQRMKGDLRSIKNLDIQRFILLLSNEFLRYTEAKVAKEINNNDILYYPICYEKSEFKSDIYVLFEDISIPGLDIIRIEDLGNSIILNKFRMPIRAKDEETGKMTNTFEDRFFRTDRIGVKEEITDYNPKLLFPVYALSEKFKNKYGNNMINYDQIFTLIKSMQ